MEINLITLVGIGLAAMFFGYFFGLFEGADRAPKNERPRKRRIILPKATLDPYCPLPARPLRRLKTACLPSSSMR